MKFPARRIGPLATLAASVHGYCREKPLFLERDFRKGAADVLPIARGAVGNAYGGLGKREGGWMGPPNIFTDGAKHFKAFTHIHVGQGCSKEG